MGIKMSDTFILPLDFSDRGDKGGELRENGSPIFMRGCKYKAEFAAIAINSYDANQSLIAKQAEQINIMHEALLMIINLQTYDPDDSHHMVNAAEQAIEATKEQS